jgi:acetyl-CoA C-acetyltransferase
MQRADLSAYPAAALASRRALELAGVVAPDIAFFDLYSCFPIAVFAVREAFSVAPDDPRPLTMTGGLPFFGGAGNNYSMHAIAAMTRALRAQPGTFGFVGANGGFLSKYSTGVYSTTPSYWSGLDSRDVQAEIDAWPAPPLAPEAAMRGSVETYTVDYGRDAPAGVLICRTDTGERFAAMTDPEDGAVVQRMIAEEPLGARIETRRDERGRRVVADFSPATAS